MTFKTTIERLIYDPWVRCGRQPSRLFLHLFDKVNSARLTRVAEKHPFFKYKLFDEQTTAFSFSRNSLIWLFARLQKTKPKSILEMETGISTLAHANIDFAQLGEWAKLIVDTRNAMSGKAGRVIKA